MKIFTTLDISQPDYDIRKCIMKSWDLGFSSLKEEPEYIILDNDWQRNVPEDLVTLHTNWYLENKGIKTGNTNGVRFNILKKYPNSIYLDSDVWFYNPVPLEIFDNDYYIHNNSSGSFFYVKNFTSSLENILQDYYNNPDRVNYWSDMLNDNEVINMYLGKCRTRYKFISHIRTSPFHHYDGLIYEYRQSTYDKSLSLFSEKDFVENNIYKFFKRKVGIVHFSEENVFKQDKCTHHIDDRTLSIYIYQMPLSMKNVISEKFDIKTFIPKQNI